MRDDITFFLILINNILILKVFNKKLIIKVKWK
jgi:hypothetical protein